MPIGLILTTGAKRDRYQPGLNVMVQVKEHDQAGCMNINHFIGNWPA